MAWKVFEIEQSDPSLAGVRLHAQNPKTGHH